MSRVDIGGRGVTVVVFCRDCDSFEKSEDARLAVKTTSAGVGVLF
jgi:hypothetical protein